MPTAPPDLPGVTHSYVDLRTGVRVHVAQAGSAGATPVLALHGWPQHWWSWRRVIPLLADDFRIVAPDLRGLGWSGFPDDGDFRKQRLADDAIALLDALGLDRAHVLGHDWGGFAGLLLALQAPERIQSLLVIGMGHLWVRPQKLAVNAWRLVYQPPVAVPWIGEAIVRDGRYTRALLRTGWGDEDAWDDAAADLYVDVLRQPGQARASSLLYRHFLARDVPEAARGRFEGKRLTMPARLLFGRRDPLGSAFAEGFERHGDDAALELLDGCGHFVPEERPELVAQRTREMFSRVRAGT